MVQQIINVDDTATAMMLAELKQNAGGAMVVTDHVELEDGTIVPNTNELVNGTVIKRVLSKTWQEIWDAMQADNIILLKGKHENKLAYDILYLGFISEPGNDEIDGYNPNYRIRFGEFYSYECENPTDYPYRSGEINRPM